MWTSRFRLRLESIKSSSSAPTAELPECQGLAGLLLRATSEEPTRATRRANCRHTLNAGRAPSNTSPGSNPSWPPLVQPACPLAQTAWQPPLGLPAASLPSAPHLSHRAWGVLLKPIRPHPSLTSLPQLCSRHTSHHGSPRPLHSCSTRDLALPLACKALAGGCPLAYLRSLSRSLPHQL